MYKSRTILTWISLFFLSWISCNRGPIPAKRVVLIGIDGMSLEGFQAARTPNLRRLVRRGALSLKARSVLPTVSSPNWASVLMGAGPEQHGITSNEWQLGIASIEPTAFDQDGYFPSIFHVLKDADRGYKTAMFYDWPDLIRMINLNYLDEIHLSAGYEESFSLAAEYIIREKPAFTFIYAGHPDEVLHESGHLSDAYIRSIERVDSALGIFLDDLETAFLFEDTHFLMVSDHGGFGNSHGGESMDELVVPWILAGPGIIHNRMVEQPVNLFDTAPTIAALFSLTPHPAWIGRQVKGAFRRHIQDAVLNSKEYVPMPTASIRSGLYTGPTELKFRADGQDLEIFYTTNGQKPDAHSIVYREPVVLTRSSRIIAVAMRNQKAQSQLRTVEYTQTIPVASLSMTFQPSPKYPGKGARSLVDRVLAGPDYRNPAWIGFEESDLETTLDLGEIRSVEAVTLRCLENKSHWIFLPSAVSVWVSQNGNDYRLVSQLGPADIHQPAAGIASLTRRFSNMKCKFIKIHAKNIGHCPEGHPGAGGKAWLFVDEIYVE